jgi:hypothetical protein
MFLVERADFVYRRRVDHRPLQSLTFEQIADAGGASSGARNSDEGCTVAIA